MNYNEIQKQQIRANIHKIVDYIEKNILPHITYSYETGRFGQIYSIGLSGTYSDQIRFYCGNTWYNADVLPDEEAVVFLQYWQDAKSYMNTEIKNNAETVKLIENFEI